MMFSITTSLIKKHHRWLNADVASEDIMTFNEQHLLHYCIMILGHINIQTNDMWHIVLQGYAGLYNLRLLFFSLFFQHAFFNFLSKQVPRSHRLCQRGAALLQAWLLPLWPLRLPIGGKWSGTLCCSQDKLSPVPPPRYEGFHTSSLPSFWLLCHDLFSTYCLIWPLLWCIDKLWVRRHRCIFSSQMLCIH